MRGRRRVVTGGVMVAVASVPLIGSELIELDAAAGAGLAVEPDLPHAGNWSAVCADPKSRVLLMVISSYARPSLCTA